MPKNLSNLNIKPGTILEEQKNEKEKPEKIF